MLQRKTGKFGRRLGKPTGWAHKISLKRKGESRLLEIDTVIVCAGQESNNSCATSADSAHLHVIGGAELAAEIDAKRAIDQGCRLVARL